MGKRMVDIVYVGDTPNYILTDEGKNLRMVYDEVCHRHRWTISVNSIDDWSIEFVKTTAQRKSVDCTSAFRPSIDRYLSADIEYLSVFFSKDGDVYPNRQMRPLSRLCFWVH